MTKFIQKSIVVGELDVVSQFCSHVNNCNIQDTESNRNAGQGGGPGLQPPGQHLGAVITISVTRYRVSTTVWHRLPHIDVVKTIKNLCENDHSSVAQRKNLMRK